MSSGESSAPGHIIGALSNGTLIDAEKAKKIIKNIGCSSILTVNQDDTSDLGSWCICTDPEEKGYFLRIDLEDVEENLINQERKFRGMPLLSKEELSDLFK